MEPEYENDDFRYIIRWNDYQMTLYYNDQLQILIVVTINRNGQQRQNTIQGIHNINPFLRAIVYGNDHEYLRDQHYHERYFQMSFQEYLQQNPTIKFKNNTIYYKQSTQQRNQLKLKLIRSDKQIEQIIEQQRRIKEQIIEQANRIQIEQLRVELLTSFTLQIQLGCEQVSIQKQIKITKHDPIQKKQVEKEKKQGIKKKEQGPKMQAQGPKMQAQGSGMQEQQIVQEETIVKKISVKKVIQDGAYHLLQGHYLTKGYLDSAYKVMHIMDSKSMQAITNTLKYTNFKSLQKNLSQKVKEKNKNFLGLVQQIVRKNDRNTTQVLKKLVCMSKKSNKDVQKKLQKFIQIYMSQQNVNLCDTQTQQQYLSSQQFYIDFSTPETFLKIFIYMYSAEFLYKQLNKQMREYQFPFSAQITALVVKGIKIILQNGNQNYIVGDDLLLYRGVSGLLIDQNSSFDKIWNQFSSCSLDRDVARSFCQDKKNQNQLYYTCVLIKNYVDIKVI